MAAPNFIKSSGDTVKKKLIVWITTSAFLGAGALSALAHGGATGIVKERMDSMSAMGEAIKSLSTMFKSGAYDPDLIRTGAMAIKSHAGESMLKLFPEGSDDTPSEARAEIWNNWEEFATLAMELENFAVGLAAASNNPPQSAEQNLASSGTMMGTDTMGATGMDGDMMGNSAPMPTFEMLAQMPADNAFEMVVTSCSSCHTKYRLEK